MCSCAIQQTIDYIFLFYLADIPHHIYIHAPSYHLYTYIKSEQPKTNFPNFRICSNNSKNTIWRKLEKCSFDISLVVANLVKGFMSFVAGYFVFKLIRPFEDIYSHVHTDRGAIRQFRNIHC